MAVIRCPGCGRPLPWAGKLQVDGALCLPCLKRWLAEQREPVSA